MNHAHTMIELYKLGGVTFALKHGRLIATPGHLLADEARTEIQAHKPLLMAALGAPLHTLYTYGYGNTPVGKLQEAVRYARVAIADIRQNPNSSRREWCLASLQSAFKGQYRHFPALGNTNYGTDEPIALAAPEQALLPLCELLLTSPVILLCGCADPSKCHRSMAAQWLTERLPGLRIANLAPHDAEVNIIAEHLSDVLASLSDAGNPKADTLFERMLEAVSKNDTEQLYSLLDAAYTAQEGIHQTREAA